MNDYIRDCTAKTDRVWLLMATAPNGGVIRYYRAYHEDMDPEELDEMEQDLREGLFARCEGFFGALDWYNVCIIPNPNKNAE